MTSTSHPLWFLLRGFLGVIPSFPAEHQQVLHSAALDGFGTGFRIQLGRALAPKCHWGGRRQQLIIGPAARLARSDRRLATARSAPKCGIDVVEWVTGSLFGRCRCYRSTGRPRHCFSPVATGTGGVSTGRSPCEMLCFLCRVLLWFPFRKETLLFLLGCPTRCSFWVWGRGGRGIRLATRMATP